jgi:two-component system CheB/CheR fusion protein
MTRAQKHEGQVQVQIRIQIQIEQLRAANAELCRRAEEAEQALAAIRTGEVDSLVVEGADGLRIFSLEGSIQSYRVLVEEMNEGAATLGDDGTILYCNASFARMLGAPLERVMGSSLQKHLAPRPDLRLDGLLQRSLDVGVRVEAALLGIDGDEVPAILSLSAMVEEGQQIHCLVATDLRQQKRNEALVAAQAAARATEAALREADRAKNEFLAVLSHELRNPLAPIKSSLHILERVPQGDVRATQARAVIARQTAQLARLVDDLLDLTRIQRNKVVLKLALLDLNEIVRRTVEDHRPLFEARGVRFSATLDARPVMVKADRVRIAQVVGNLLGNALKFTDPGGSVLVSVERDAEKHQAVLRVADTGMGVAPEILDRIFEPFTQADQTLDRSKGGLGLGLALVKDLVGMHGGEVSAHSAGPGRGAEIVVRLALALDEVMPLPSVQPCSPPCRPPRHVLIVEDNVDTADCLQQALALDGHQVEVAYNGLDGVSMARRLHPEVVFCDIGLPGMNGYEVARILRLDPLLDGVFLVALSGYARPEDLECSTEAGFDWHLAKPASFEQIDKVFEAVTAARTAPRGPGAA